jgi:hypothetical protein
MNGAKDLAVGCAAALLSLCRLRDPVALKIARAEKADRKRKCISQQLAL